MPAESDWILHAPYDFDRACIRNAFIYNLSNQTGNYAVRTRFVEVFLNYSGGDLSWNDYAGLYVFMEKIKRDKNRVDVKNIKPLDNSEPEISGGYILRVDKASDNQTLLSGTEQGRVYCIDPAPEEFTAQQKTYLENYMIGFESQMENPDPLTGYAKYIDVASAIDHNLLNLLPMNVDGLRLSAYMSKDRNGKLHFGPIWDFDRSMESTDGRDNDPELWHGKWDCSYYIEQDRPVPPNRNRNLWWGHLFKNADFWQLYIDRWHELRQTVFSTANVNTTIDSLAAEVDEARERDITRWGQNPRTGSNGLDGTRQGEINHLKWWLETRSTWIDNQFIPAPQLSHDGGRITNSILLTMSQTAVTTNYYTLDGSDPRAPGGLPAASALACTGSIYIIHNTIIKSRAWDGTLWSSNPPAEAPWSPPSEGLYIANIPQLAVTEIMYNPAPPSSNTETNFTASDFEFIEIQNTGSTTEYLAGVEFTEGISYDFSTGAVKQLAPGEYLVIVKNMTAFTNRYTNSSSINIAGEYSDSLSDSGEAISLAMPSISNTIASFSFNDWYSNTDGEGFSLNIRNSHTASADRNQAESWKPSSYIYGSPGTADPDAVPSPGAIIINEMLTHQDQDNPGDWVELYNTTTNSVDIKGWFISDNAATPAKIEITNDLTLASHGYIILTEWDHFGTNAPGTGTNGFALSEHGGETVCISSGSGGSITGFRTTQSFDAAANSVTFGRYTKSDGSVDFTALSYPTINASNAYPLVGDITISEIAYQNSNSYEFVELYNSSSSPISLFDSLYPSNTWNISGGIEFTFPSNTTIAATGRLLIIPTNKTAFIAMYTNIPPSTVLTGDFAGKLNNDGETIRLYRPGPPDKDTGYVPYILVEKVKYDDNAPWPQLTEESGASLERINVHQYANDSINWAASFITATPGHPAQDADYDGMDDDWENNHFGSAANGNAEADTDGDGFINLSEYLADTNPTNAASLLHIGDITGSSNIIIKWQSSGGKSYAIEEAASLDQGFTVTTGGIAATPPLNCCTIDVNRVESRFYRIILE